MTYRQLQPRKEQLEQLQGISTEEELTEEQVAAIIRQSTTAQTRENLESADLQLSGAQRFAISRGLQADRIMIAHEGDGKRGVSGTLRIDQREKLQQVMAGIEQGKIKVVWAYSVSRLFRDRYGVQSGTFIEACAKHHVKVVIDTMVFDFSDPLVGSMHRMMFQFAAIMAAKENDDRSKLLHEAKRNKALRGEYDGRPLTPGFIVDRDKKSPTYNHYILYPPHQQALRKLYARYRWHGGQFNKLAHEVEQMRVVFPPFEDGIDKLNKSKFQFVEVCSVHGPNRKTKVKGTDGKRHLERTGCNLEGPNCTLIGYHISHEALQQLLQSVEHAGYWTVDNTVLTDDNGQPIKYHDAIWEDDLSDWEYAFYELSPTLLNGEPNPDYIDPRATWQAATVKKQDREPQTFLLPGFLTSPLGIVHYSNGKINVGEKRSENSNQYSTTLWKDAYWIEYEFRRRLLDRIEDTNYEQMLYDALRNVQAHNAQALTSVDEQIANYEQTIKTKKAQMDALGEKFDKQTLEEYNQAIIDARANIAALKAKQNEAAIEEQDLQDLCTELWNFRNHGKRTNEKLIRLIRLATSAISIDEYSSHFITLTVAWCAPFPQVDVCYFYREDGGRNGWSKEDEADLRKLYPHADRADILQRFPTKTWLAITSYANDRGIERCTRLNTSGITDRFLSLADWKLMQKYGWKREKKAHWRLDVLLSESDGLSTASG